MVRHIVAWNYAEGLTEEEQKEKALLIKTELKKLKEIVDGVISIEIWDSPLETSEADLILDSIFESEEALQAYQEHPEHVKVAASIIRPATRNRKCIDLSMGDSLE